MERAETQRKILEIGKKEFLEKGSCKYTYRNSDREWKSQTQTIEPYAAAIENYER